MGRVSEILHGYNPLMNWMSALMGLVSAGIAVASATTYTRQEQEIKSRDEQIEVQRDQSLTLKIDNNTCTSTLEVVNGVMEQVKQDLLTCVAEKDRGERRLQQYLTEFIMTYHAPLVPAGPIEMELRRGSRIEIKMVDSSAYLTMDRLTDKGPILVLTDCAGALSSDATTVEQEGPPAYLLSRDEGLLRFRLSSDCCRNGFERCSRKRLDQVVINLVHYDVEEQMNAVVSFSQETVHEG